MRNVDRADAIRYLAGRLCEQVEAHEAHIESGASRYCETRGEGHTVAEIKRTVSIMRDELLQLGKSLR